MTKGKWFWIFFSGLILISCQKYEKQEGCHLDKMHIKGDVVKIESIVQSTMPLTELYANAFNPEQAISTCVGNVEIDFDYHGNVKSVIGYGIDGKKLFDTGTIHPSTDACSSPAVLIGPGANQDITNIKTVSNGNGDIVGIKYFSNGDLVWDQKAFYNEDGSFYSVVKDYPKFNILTEFFNVTYSDTTTYKYLSYDEMGNWTEVEISYKGVLPKHSHTFRIKRQLTYYGEGKKNSLISQLKQYNKSKMELSDESDLVLLGQYGSMRIPHYMVVGSENAIEDLLNSMPAAYRDQIHYLFLSTYDKNDAYATISVSYTRGGDPSGFDNLTAEDMMYDEEVDRYFEEENTVAMAQGNTYILKWLPYQFLTVSGRRALKYTYYRYGNGSPIPVYCENYMIPMRDGNLISIIFSFQSNLYNRFYKDFDSAIKSIQF